MITAKAIEYMLIDAVLAAEPYMKIAEQIEDPKRYIYLTDDIKLRIQATTEPVRISHRCLSSYSRPTLGAPEGTRHISPD